jgi:hypothetical protein
MSKPAKSTNWERQHEIDRRAIKLIESGEDIPTAYRKAMESMKLQPEPK